jgi:hypothetical protein
MIKLWKTITDRGPDLRRCGPNQTSGGTVDAATRPALKPGLRRLWRDDSTLQLGLDPRRAVVLTGLPARMSRLLDYLDGTLDRAGVLRAAAELGIDPRTTARFLSALQEAGTLDDATVAPSLGSKELEHLAPDLASLSLLTGRVDGGSTELARRRSARVWVCGESRLAGSVADLLRVAGVGSVVASTSEPGEAPDLVIVSPKGHVEPPLRERLLREATPHLLAIVQELTGVIGPLVLPGRTACLRCQDLHRSSRDDAWPLLAAQLAGRPRGYVEACDSTLATIVAGYAASQALSYLDGTIPNPPTMNGSLEITLPDWQVRRRSWPRHPACGCWW